MDAFERELMRRSPLAAATLESFDFVFTDAVLDSIYQAHRGRCYQDKLTFPRMVSLMRDALLRHEGSGHRLFVELERAEQQPVDESNFYRKLARMPVAVSRALLSQGAARLGELMPHDVVSLPGCFDDYQAVVIDGKKIKNAAKRLAPTRGFSGKLLGAKALVAMNARSGLAIAMSDSLDGEANDVPLVPALLDQLHELVPATRPVLFLADRQFDNLTTLRRLGRRRGDAFAVRVRKNLKFAATSRRRLRDAAGREVVDEIGLFGSGQGARVLRRITLVRPGQEDVIILTDLLDQTVFHAEDLLELYRHRWGIERVFQQVTEVFSLSHLIGSHPQAILFQFAFCLLLYNLVQVIQAYVAQDGRVLASCVSTFYLFHDIQRELTAWAYHAGADGGPWPRTPRTAPQMRERLRQLLEGSWDPIGYTKASDKRPRRPKVPKRPLHGGHSSVQRLLEGRAKVMGRSNN